MFHFPLLSIIIRNSYTTFQNCNTSTLLITMNECLIAPFSVFRFFLREKEKLSSPNAMKHRCWAFSWASCTYVPSTRTSSVGSISTMEKPNLERSGVFVNFFRRQQYSQGVISKWRGEKLGKRGACIDSCLDGRWRRSLAS